MSETHERINAILVEHLGCEPEAITPETLIVPSHDGNGRVVDGPADLGADSLDVVELVMMLEEEFGVAIPDDESDTLNTGTVQALYDLVDSKLAER